MAGRPPKKVLIILGVLALVVIIVFGVILLVISRDGTSDNDQPITLSYWGVFDSAEVIQPIIDKYQEQNPNVQIIYEQKSFDSYEDELRNAFAEDRGPDIFSLPNTQIQKWQNFLEPAEGALTLIDNYYDVVEKDVIVDGNAYGLPYSVDSLALFYNKRIFRDAGISNPPRTWEEFDDAVQKLTELDPSGKFVSSGAALGGSEATINRATDILAFFMMQEGTTITSREDSAVVLNKETTDLLGQVNEEPGKKGLDRYLGYSKPTNPNYTWNDGQNYSFDFFAQEKVAMIFNYAFSIPIVKDNNPKLDFGIAPAPQPENATRRVSYASYWVETVSKEASDIATAWDFIIFATNQENVKLYSSLANKPVSRRDLVNEELNDAELGAFATQNLYAESWYQYDSVAVEDVLNDMIVNILTGETIEETALSEATSEIGSIITQQNDEN